MKKIIIANWKNNLSLKESLVLAKSYAKVFSGQTVVACPSLLSLVSVKDILGQKVKLGAQDVGWQQRGAHTGEVDVKSLAEIACAYVLLGHSERRLAGESCRQVNLKLQAVLQEKKLTPVVCIGESQSDYQAKKGRTFVAGQIKRALAGLKNSQRQIVFAYEPIWAIGTGKAMPAKEAQAMHEFIKKEIKKNLGNKAPSLVLYGGSVNGKNAKDYLAQADIDGLLVGGASLKIQEFKKIANIS